ncbi:Imm10 family immunity protein [Burkholderia territorii]|uniref:Imm10 family immunity protein n=1 Tax=Burkholderia territorii TaxID=1503055 RepID=UPI001E42AC7A
MNRKAVEVGLKANGVLTVENDSNMISFQAAVTAIYAEDGVLTVAFADSTSAEPESYLILQQEIPRVPGDESDDYYFEISGRSMSGEGGFKDAYFDGDDLVVTFAEDIVKKYSSRGLRIVGVKLTCDVAELKLALHNVFDNTRCSFDAQQ